MQKFVFVALVCAIAFAVPVTPAAAQDNIKVEIVGKSEGQLFSAIVRLDWGKKDAQSFDIHPQGKAEKKLGELVAGVHTIHTIHSRLGFPQPVVYSITESGKTLWTSEQTVDPRRVDLKAGQTLTVSVLRPYEPYDGKFGKVRGVPIALIFPRPYWYQSIRPGEFKGKEQFPNSIFFLVHKDWGPEKVMERVATFTVEKLDDPKHEQGDYRPEVHASCLIGFDADGKIPELIRKADRKELQVELKKELLRLFEAWKAEKCYRSYSPQDVAALKELKWLPADFQDGPADIPISDGLKYAEPLLEQWLKDKK